jgi:cytidylate kinase
MSGDRGVNSSVTERDVITVDGIGASGKSALARLLAQRLGYGHLNSGLLYRAAGWLMTRSGVDLNNPEKVTSELSRHSISLGKDADSRTIVFIDGEACGDELQSSEVSIAASLVSRFQSVRDKFTELQRGAFAPSGVVAEGRDMGTIIFPYARVKFFVQGRLDVRAGRRYAQLKGTPQESTLDGITRDLAERDARDAGRPVAPAKPAPGAVIVDNSDRPLNEVVEAMYRVVVGRDD